MTTKFRGEVGYGIDTEVKPGSWKKVISERKYRGTVLRTSRSLQENDKVNRDIRVNNPISIVADAYAFEHFFAILYVKWAGVRWIVSDVEVEHPRLILRLGGVYSGGTPPAESGETP